MGDVIPPRRSPDGRPPKLFVTVGQRLGRGVVTDPEVRVGIAPYAPRGFRGARLLCDCGNIYESQLSVLLRQVESTKSCGCLNAETASRRRMRMNQEDPPRRTHALSGHQLYKTWLGMVQRCGNPAAPNYALYGARGISVCEAWHDPAVFIAWVEMNLGPRPRGMTPDRINNAKGYEVGNVRWATQSEQNRNRRQIQVKLTSEAVTEIRRRYAAGEVQRLLASEFGITQSCVSQIVLGKTWHPERVT